MKQGARHDSPDLPDLTRRNKPASLSWIVLFPCLALALLAAALIWHASSQAAYWIRLEPVTTTQTGQTQSAPDTGSETLFMDMTTQAALLHYSRTTQASEQPVPRETAPRAANPPTVSPTPPLPTPYPRHTDSNGIPQEGVPVDVFVPDHTVFYVREQGDLREMPNTGAAIIGKLTRGDPVKRLGFGLDWSRVTGPDGQTGYVLNSLISKQFIAKPTPSPSATPSPKPTRAPTVTPTTKPTRAPTAAPTVTPTQAPAPTVPPTPLPTAEPTAVPTATPTQAPTPTVTAAASPSPPPATATPAPPTGSGLSESEQQALIELARSLIGTPYVYARMSPEDGFDCSGFTSYVYKTLFGIKLPRTARDQSGYGRPVSSSDIAIGDILCFDWFKDDGICDHVGLYIGNGRYVHASSSDRTYYPDRGAVKEATVVFGRSPVISIRRIIP
ncbi:MAG: SH3 domain-containing protein [Clostridiaceae bacterium]|jgi:cell wall-associated NlpC family hydrolase|nr:SH3 domain-containing protein [Clostridiaceae bacterium]